MDMIEIDPIDLKPGDKLCGADGVPFASVTSKPKITSGMDGRWVETTMLPVEFLSGTTVPVIPNRDYSTGSENGMSFICNRWTFTGPEGYRVAEEEDGNGFRVNRYDGSQTQLVWTGPGSRNMSEEAAHRLAASLARPSHLRLGVRP